MFTSIYQLIVAFILFAFLAFLEYLDWHGRADVLKAKHPRLWAFIHKRPTRLVLLVIILGFLVKDFRDAVAIAPPPSPVKIVPPSPPPLTIVRMNPPMKEQCWVRNYSTPGNLSYGLTTMLCNAKYDAPFFLTIEYDQNLASTEAITFPIDGGSHYEMSLHDNKISAYFDVPSIKPNEPFSVVVHGSKQQPPLVKKVMLKTKSGVIPNFSY